MTTEITFMQQKLMERKGYRPGCGVCRPFQRTVFNGEQFECKYCGWVSGYDKDFIQIYKQKWGMK